MLFPFKRIFPMLAIMVVGSLFLAPMEASASCAWSIVPSPSQGDDSALGAVSADSATDAWAVGFYSILLAPPYQNNFPLAERWDGKTWQIVSSPSNSNQDQFSGVAAISPTNAWAVGSLIEHWNGRRWSIVPGPAAIGGYLASVKAISYNDIWAVGILNHRVTLIEHWNGARWSVVPSPNRFYTSQSANYLLSVTGTGPKDVWAVGYSEMPPPNFSRQTLAEHWDGTRWSIVPTPNSSGAKFVQLSSVSALATNNVFAVGSAGYPSGRGIVQRTLAEHWNGSRWAIQSTPNETNFTGFSAVAAVSPTEVLGVGSFYAPDAHTYAARWMGSRWMTTITPNANQANYFSGASTIPGTTDVWAAGGFSPAYNGTLIERYHC